MSLTIFHSLGRAGMHPLAKEALLTKHYLKRLPPVTHSFMVWGDDNDVVGVVTFGVPPSRHLQISACPSNPDLVLELNRLWLDDKLPRNTASHVMARVLDQMPPQVIVSYADTAAGHEGYVYRACNFFYAGWTDMERKTPRFDYVPRNGNHSRDAFRTGEFDRVRRKPKMKYWTVTGNRTEKKQMLRLAGWPKLNWKNDNA
jgi:hypothetical protein